MYRALGISVGPGPKTIELARAGNGNRRVPSVARDLECVLTNNEEHTVTTARGDLDPYGGLSPDRLFVECPTCGYLPVPLAEVTARIKHYRATMTVATIPA